MSTPDTFRIRCALCTRIVNVVTKDGVEKVATHDIDPHLRMVCQGSGLLRSVREVLPKKRTKKGAKSP